MCTLIIGHRIDPDYPLIVGANRNEMYDRPAIGPELREDTPIPILAPKDLKAGGTWLGINARGVFAGLTNRFGRSLEPERRSRGELVPKALAHPSAAEAADQLRELTATDYNPFHLVIADRDSVHLVISDGQLVTVSEVGDQLLIVTERSLGAADHPRKIKARNECLQRLENGRLDEDDLREILTMRSGHSFESICVDIPEFEYGTRSSTILKFGQSPDDTLLWYADGSPCEVEFEDISDQARDLLQ